jgi:hypothetical protein
VNRASARHALDPPQPEHPLRHRGAERAGRWWRCSLRALERDLSPAERAYARHGEDGPRYSVYRRWEPAARNEVWEADHGELDIRVLPLRGRRLVRSMADGDRGWVLAAGDWVGVELAHARERLSVQAWPLSALRAEQRALWSRAVVVDELGCGWDHGVSQAHAAGIPGMYPVERVARRR